MKETAAAERYARALYEVLSEKKSLGPEAARRELDHIRELILARRDLALALKNPLFPVERKKSALRHKLAGPAEPSPVVLRFMDLLIERKRLELLPLILACFDRVSAESRGRIKAFVSSAQALEAAAQARLEKDLTKLFGKKVEVETSVRPELLAGLVVRAGDTVIDNSLRTKLKRLRQQVKAGENL